MAAPKAVTSAADAQALPVTPRRRRGGAQAGSPARWSIPTATGAARSRTSSAASSGSSSRTSSSRPRSRSAARSTGSRCLAEERQARRHRHVRRQPRPGRGLSRPPAVDPRHHRHAREHADREGGQHPPARRRGDPDGETVEEAAAFALAARPRQGAHLHPPLRRSAGDRRPGHAGAGDAGHRAGNRYAGRADRRRRADLRHGRCRQGLEARHPRDRRAGGALPLHVQRHQRRAPADARRHAGRGHCRQGAGPHHPGDRAPARSTTSCSSPSRRSSAR